MSGELLMSRIDRTLKEIRPGLRLVAPQTYYISWGFGLFNILAGLSLFNFPQQKFLIVGAISLRIWSVLFVFFGLLFIYTLLTNNWRGTRFLHITGVAIKTAWLLELVTRSIAGKSLILVFIWALLIYLQAITYIYFTPVESKDVG